MSLFLPSYYFSTKDSKLRWCTNAMSATMELLVNRGAKLTPANRDIISESYCECQQTHNIMSRDYTFYGTWSFELWNLVEKCLKTHNDLEEALKLAEKSINEHSGQEADVNSEAEKPAYTETAGPIRQSSPTAKPSIATQSSTTKHPLATRHYRSRNANTRYTFADSRTSNHFTSFHAPHGFSSSQYVHAAHGGNMIIYPGSTVTGATLNYGDDGTGGRRTSKSTYAKYCRPIFITSPF